MGGIQIVLRLKLRTANGFFFFVSKRLFKRTMSFLINHVSESPTATDEEDPHASDNEEDLLIVLTDGEAEDD